VNVRAVQADGSVSCETSETLVSVFCPSGGAPDGAKCGTSPTIRIVSQEALRSKRGSARLGPGVRGSVRRPLGKIANCCWNRSSGDFQPKIF
jgi:hypothetical protein